MTVFASDRLPLNYMQTDKVPKFLTELHGNKTLGAPIGDEKRLQSFPKVNLVNY